MGSKQLTNKNYKRNDVTFLNCKTAKEITVTFGNDMPKAKSIEEYKKYVLRQLNTNKHNKSLFVIFWKKMGLCKFSNLDYKTFKKLYGK